MAHQEGKCPGSLFLQHRNSSLNWKTDVVVILVVPVTSWLPEKDNYGPSNFIFTLQQHEKNNNAP